MRGSRPIPALVFILGLFLVLNYVSDFKTGLPWKLIVEDPRCGHIYYDIPVRHKDVFTLSYRHSVSGSRVYGTFEITHDAHIDPLTTSYTSFGPGLPWLDATVHYTIENGIITVFHDVEPPRGHIRLWVSPETGETITLNGHSYQLARFSEFPVLVEIRVNQVYD